MSILAVDIGGTKVALRHEDGGAPPYEAVVRWSDGASRADDLALLRAAVAAVPGGSRAVGLSLPATVDVSGTVTSWPNRPSWVGLDWAGVVADLFPATPAATADDGDLAALAEAEHAGRSDVLYLGVGTGVGGGVVSAGRPVPRQGRGSCEVGHVVVALDGPRCDCGRRGCLQAIASGPAVLRTASRARGYETGYDELREGWRAGAPWADVAVRVAGRALAAAVVGVGELLRVDLAVIGGGFAAGVPDLTAVVADQVADYARVGHPVPAVRAAALGGASSLHGAVSLARSLRVGAPR
ncbi:ROK family protein [Pseudonocardia oroxyli]|uniref:ROK family protein n=1 Tax=Pseudonocardia oroxyli TaxID=366584 RepID=UPI001FE202FE|nr:ROK family protein [Pseudonocardia oroxyli]